MKPELLKIYVTLCDCLSFSRTAEILNHPRSTISDAIKRLEQISGVRLITRTTRKVQITEEGQRFYEKSLTVLEGLSELESLFSSEDNFNARGRVRVDMPVAMAKNFIIPQLPNFRDSYPLIDIEIGSSDRQVDLVSEGFDFVLRVGKLNDSSYICRKIGDYELINCVGANYIKKYGRPKLSQLNQHLLIHYQQNLGVGNDSFEYFDGKKYQTVKMKSSITVNNTISYTEACLAGMGMIQVPRIGVMPYIKKGTLIEVMPRHRARPMAVYIVYPTRERIPHRVQVFINWCEEVIKEYL